MEQTLMAARLALLILWNGENYQRMVEEGRFVFSDDTVSVSFVQAIGVLELMEKPIFCEARRLTDSTLGITCGHVDLVRTNSEDARTRLHMLRLRDYMELLQELGYATPIVVRGPGTPFMMDGHALIMFLRSFVFDRLPLRMAQAEDGDVGLILSIGYTYAP